jgi:hypothetical protein
MTRLAIHPGEVLADELQELRNRSKLSYLIIDSLCGWTS